MPRPILIMGGADLKDSFKTLYDYYADKYPHRDILFDDEFSNNPQLLDTATENELKKFYNRRKSYDVFLFLPNSDKTNLFGEQGVLSENVYKFMYEYTKESGYKSGAVFIEDDDGGLIEKEEKIQNNKNRIIHLKGFEKKEKIDYELKWADKDRIQEVIREDFCTNVTFPKPGKSLLSAIKRVWARLKNSFKYNFKHDLAFGKYDFNKHTLSFHQTVLDNYIKERESKGNYKSIVGKLFGQSKIEKLEGAKRVQAVLNGNVKAKQLAGYYDTITSGTLGKIYRQMFTEEVRLDHYITVRDRGKEFETGFGRLADHSRTKKVRAAVELQKVYRKDKVGTAATEWMKLMGKKYRKEVQQGELGRIYKEIIRSNPGQC